MNLTTLAQLRNLRALNRCLPAEYTVIDFSISEASAAPLPLVFDVWATRDCLEGENQP